MDLKKTGLLIAQKRKEKNLTQKQLAQQLGVTDKAISRWETGTGFPDASLLQPLAQLLDVSISELVTGEPAQPGQETQQAEHALLDALRYTAAKYRKETGLILAVFGIGMAATPLYLSVQTGVNADIVLVFACALLTASGWLISAKSKPTAKLSKWLAFGSICLALVLEVLPISAVLIFAGPDYYNRELYSCFDPILVGYANIGPFMAGILTAAVFLMLIPIMRGKGQGVRSVAFSCTVVGAIFMLGMPLLFGQQWLTGAGLAVALLLITSAIFQKKL